MVNTGRPSAACQTCKLRRIRCDLVRPTCSQCHKSKRLCLGYSPGSGIEPKALALQSVGPARHDASQRTGPHCSPTYALEDLLLAAAQNTGFGSYVRSPIKLASILTKRAPGLGETSLISHTLRTIATGLTLLALPSQSHETRRTQLLQYQIAVHRLRLELHVGRHTADVQATMFLLSLYEMIVCSNPGDRTWQTHGDAFLALINANTPFTVPTIAREQAQVAFQVHHTVLRLQDIARDFDILFRDANTRPRKLDVQKLRAAAQKVDKSLLMFPKLKEIHYESSDAQLCYQDKYHALVIVNASMLLRTGTFLKGDIKYRYVAEHRILHERIHAACGAIEASARSALDEVGIRQKTDEFLLESQEPRKVPKSRLLGLVWPLACSFIVPDMNNTDLQDRRDLLSMIGQIAALPLASTLSGQCPVKAFDLITGVMLTGLVA